MKLEAEGRCMKFVKLMALALVVGVSAGAVAQGWTVKQEWVRAHEEFLASDVMAGRGSATRDEEIAATYVASRFLADGWRPSPGMAGYLQRVDLGQPVLDGHGALSVGGARLEE